MSVALQLERDRAYRGLLDLILGGGVEPEAPLSEHDSEDVQQVDLPCDIAGSFYPAADVDTFQFAAKKGETWWIEVASDLMTYTRESAWVDSTAESLTGKIGGLSIITRS